MKRISVLAVAMVLSGATAAYAAWSVSKEGAWPKTWPAELEPLRGQSGTIEGGLVMLAIHRIPFSTREEFEAAWPHLLSVKTKGAPIVLVRSPHNHWHFKETAAGVIIHCPPGGVERPGATIPIEHVDSLTERWLNATWIELVVDGDVVDLNRVALPADTPIIDQRFKEDSSKKPDATGK